MITTEFRAHIKSINIKSLRCHVHPEPLTEIEKGYHMQPLPIQQSLDELFWSKKDNVVDDGRGEEEKEKENVTSTVIKKRPMEHDYRYWVDEDHGKERYSKMTFKIASLDGKVFEQAYKTTNQDVIVTVAPVTNTVMNIEAVKQARKCHFCGNPRFKEKRNVWVAICAPRITITDCPDWRIYDNHVLETIERRDYRAHLAYMCGGCPKMQRDDVRYANALTMAEVRDALRRSGMSYSHSGFNINLHGVRVIPEDGIAIAGR